MNRQRRIDEELWEDSEEELSSDHVVERFFSQHERDADQDAVRKGRHGGRPKRRPAPGGEADE